MFDRILIPLDGSQLSESILAPVGRILRREDAEVELLQVVPARADTWAWGEESASAHEPDGLRDHLSAVAERLSSEGVTVHSRVVRGEPAAAILDRVEAWRPSLVAMTTHGRGGLGRIIRGSVAERVLRRCSAPLLLASPAAAKAEGEPRFRKVLVPLDPSSTAAAILPLVREVARLYEAEIVLCRVWPLWEGYPSLREAARAQHDHPDERTADLTGVRDELEEAGIRTRVRLDAGDPATRLLEAIEAEGADLVAMSTHGFGGATRWLLGSVAEKVLRAASVPVLLRRAQAAGQEVKE
ncbi:MAG: universal stress protein [Planctomycetota bacterium]